MQKLRSNPKFILGSFKISIQLNSNNGNFPIYKLLLQYIISQIIRLKYQFNHLPVIGIDRVPHSPFAIPFEVFPFLEQFAAFGQSAVVVAAAAVVATLRNGNGFETFN